MKVFRIEREKYLRTTLRGIGASMTSGFRWNSLNTKLVYTSESRALATLEMAVHLDLSEDLPTDRYYVAFYIPDTITLHEVKMEDMPDDWKAHPPSHGTQIIGDDFVLENNAAILKVPSCIVPEEFNYLINPNHPDANKIRLLSQSPLSFDPRFKSR